MNISNTAISVLEKLCSNVFKDNAPAYFIMDRLGHIQLWGGNLLDLDITEPKKSDSITNTLIFMEGLLPLKGQSMEFSCIKMPAKPCVDALLFKTDDGYGLILWDSSEKESFLSQTQQKFNELSLLIEKQKSRFIPATHEMLEKEHEIFLARLFKALNFAVMEMNDQGHFVLIGTPPPWIEHIPQSSQILAGKAHKEDIFSFLGNFIQETKSRWSRHQQGSFKSGIWIVKDHSDQELLFEATAIDIHGRKLLIISHDICHPNEKQSLIQKGRDLALNYHTLQRSGQKLKSMNDEMELRVKERTKDLENANLKLANELKERKKLQEERDKVAIQLRQSQKMEAIGTLAGGIAHDFNNILSAIMGFSELSIAQVDPSSPIKPHLEKIFLASNRAKDLVRQILTFSRQTDYDKHPLKLNQIVHEVLNLLRASLPAFIEIKSDLKSNAHILADHTHIHQVIMNLCTNAWHAMKDNGGILKVTLQDIETQPDSLIVCPELNYGRYLMLSIEDSGHGVAPEMIERIFDPYFTTKNKDKGTGLGLSVVHGIVTKYKGCITVKSKIGHGSTFTIYLPEFDVSYHEEPSEEEVCIGKNERILFVDDEQFQTQMGKELLEMIGYKVKTCNDSKKALSLFLSQPDSFDLIITDMIMPKMTGKTLAKKILEKRPDIPVLLCSGYSDDIDPEKILQTGIRQYLMKPIGMKELSLAVKNALKNN